MTDKTGAAQLYLEDLFVGMRFAYGIVQVSKQSIKEFASEYDPQPFHLDDEIARTTLFKGLAASGWQTASITMRLLVEASKSLAGGLIGAGADLSWPAPTRPGDQLRVEAEIVDINPSQSKTDRGTVSIRSSTINQDGVVVQRMVAKLIVFRRTTLLG